MPVTINALCLKNNEIIAELSRIESGVNKDEKIYGISDGGSYNGSYIKTAVSC